MRLLEQDITNWSSVAPFLDTICLPVYRYELVQKELQVEEAYLIEYITEELEKRLIGRMLLLPACSFIGEDDRLLTHTIACIRKELGNSGFHYAFLVILEGSWSKEIEDFEGINILSIKKDVDKEIELERVYQEILEQWQVD